MRDSWFKADGLHIWDSGIPGIENIPEYEGWLGMDAVALYLHIDDALSTELFCRQARGWVIANRIRKAVDACH